MDAAGRALHDEAAIRAAAYQLNGRGGLCLILGHTVFLAGYGTLGFLIEGEFFVSFSQRARQLPDVETWAVGTI